MSLKERAVKKPIMSTRIIVSEQELIPVDILALRKFTRSINFDLYLKLSDEKVTCVFSRTSGIDYKRLANYIQKGIKQLFIHKDDQPAFEAFLSSSAEKIFNDPNTLPEKKIATLLNMTEQNMAEVFSQVHVSEETSKTTQKVVRGYVEMMTRTPEMLSLILKLVSHGEYLYYHSVSVSIFSLLLAKNMGQFDQKTIENIGLGGLLHDIGFAQLPPEAIDQPEDDGEEKISPIHEHPSLGLKMLESTPEIPEEVKWIIYQHHEQPSGSGFPNRLRGKAIYAGAKVVGLADALSTYISKRPYRGAYDVQKTIEILKKLPNRYERELVALLPTMFVNKNGK